jgi:hypothetical protein
LGVWCCKLHPVLCYETSHKGIPSDVRGRFFKNCRATEEEEEEEEEEDNDRSLQHFA